MPEWLASELQISACLGLPNPGIAKCLPLYLTHFECGFGDFLVSMSHLLSPKTHTHTHTLPLGNSVRFACSFGNHHHYLISKHFHWLPKKVDINSSFYSCYPFPGNVNLFSASVDLYVRLY